ncbi:tyrosine-type recombinase/integrase [uncultured Alistipes sp.]|jgi:hypothetical protein|uniref:tyrosine-type recombinase/integrase n=1 Tax=uncultured Alistipes sp. TaxID=538949 RepID=UPI0025E3FDF3|nr:tyrosine-type recombinase/integrase [uncultured Alistipes sp.]
MAITFMLKDKKRETSNIDIFIRFRGASYKKSTGETTPPRYWNQKKKRCNTPGEFLEGNDINIVLTLWEIAAQKTIAHFKEYQNLPSPSDFWAQFNSEYYKDDGEQEVYLVDFLDKYIESIKGIRAENTVKKYRTAYNKLREYEGNKGLRISFRNINIDFYNSFKRWIYSKNDSANYFGALIKIVKRIVREASYQGITDNIRGIEHKDFVTISESIDKIYLTADEIEAIFNLDITPEIIRNEFKDEYNDTRMADMQRKVESLKIVRERFLVGAYSGLRVSDFSRLDALNFGIKTIRTTTVKTGKTVVIPIHANIRKLFDEGFDPAVKISDQKMNKQLKELARLARIKDEVIIMENVAGKYVPRKYKKYELVCTHTARRSFATNALKAGVPLPSISKILGHNKIATTEKYLRMSAEETAESLLDHDFFK